MPGRMQRRTLSALLLVAGLVLPLNPGHALPPSAAHNISSPRDLASSVWAWLTHLFDAAWRKNGMMIDPNGQPVQKNGMTIDPNGQPGGTGPGPSGTAPAHGDNGSMPDPNG
ncbi:MAG: hypothetical protein QOF89_691 [Acidobacteriota bacterium]|jgi:hypothetical protein|nr:hypothetical protein [Acidobacteriota bacterium]